MERTLALAYRTCATPSLLHLCTHLSHQYYLVRIPSQAHVVLPPHQMICASQYVLAFVLLLVQYYLTHTFIIHLPIHLLLLFILSMVIRATPLHTWSATLPT